jgi:hypothetical protein
MEGYCAIDIKEHPNVKFKEPGASHAGKWYIFKSVEQLDEELARIKA